MPAAVYTGGAFNLSSNVPLIVVLKTITRVYTAAYAEQTRPFKCQNNASFISVSVPSETEHKK